ncbi:MAG: sensor histidine kinase [Clostridia bacterium]|nr:sensor histidine kinase [Clostridia bacterium]
MKELSLNVLDITENSVKAGATLTEISILENSDTLTMIVKDDGCGMSEEILRTVENPFYTTRTTRKVGLGIPLLKMAAEMTGGSVKIVSSTDAATHGTTVTAVFYKNHLDFTPLGDIKETVVTLIQGHPDTDFLFVHQTPSGEVKLDTRELRVILEGVPLDTYEVIVWIKEYLNEQYELLENR